MPSPTRFLPQKKVSTRDTSHPFKPHPRVRVKPQTKWLQLVEEEVEADEDEDRGHEAAEVRPAAPVSPHPQARVSPSSQAKTSRKTGTQTGRPRTPVVTTGNLENPPGAAIGPNQTAHGRIW